MQYTIDVTDDLRETKAHGMPSFPLETHNCAFRLSSNGIVNWHWHPEIELSRISRGKVYCSAGSETCLLEEGQYSFINSNVLHMYAPAPGFEDSEKETIMFRPALLADPSSAVYTGYIEPIVGCSAMAFFRFDEAAAWQRQARSLFDQVYRLDRNSCFGYELRCRNLLSDMWLLFADHMRGVYQGATNSESQLINEERTKRMLDFIHRHYNEDLTVDSIAAAASISRSECFRCFKRSINKKPVEYLNEYRVEKAIYYLEHTNVPITSIGHRCGFGSPSYFGKVFRTITGASPRSYRHEPEDDAEETDGADI